MAQVPLKMSLSLSKDQKPRDDSQKKSWGLSGPALSPLRPIAAGLILGHVLINFSSVKPHFALKLANRMDRDLLILVYSMVNSSVHATMSEERHCDVLTSIHY